MESWMGSEALRLGLVGRAAIDGELDDFIVVNVAAFRSSESGCRLTVHAWSALSTLSDAVSENGVRSART
jgi:hypothetical protein